jgi:hypothetical protein
MMCDKTSFPDTCFEDLTSQFLVLQSCTSFLIILAEKEIADE